jgi:hypothetical protein
MVSPHDGTFGNDSTPQQQWEQLADITIIPGIVSSALQSPTIKPEGTSSLEAVLEARYMVTAALELEVP